MLSLVALHGVLALALVAGRSRIGRWAFPAAALGPVATLVWVATNAAAVVDGEPVLASVDWVPGLDLSFDVAVDAYGLAFLALIGAAGVAIFGYSARYFSPSPRVTGFAAAMVAFAGAMTGLVAADHLLTLFVFWELTTIASYLLIGYDDHSARARSAALHAALVTGAGGLAMLGGFVVLGEAAGTYRISELVAGSPPSGAGVVVAWVLVLIGAATKSAQVPFHGWLPGAMAAPTPASAFLHSATMVKAGIFLVGRLAPLAVIAIGWWEPVVVGIGLATMVLGGWRALRQTDLKLLLAFGTVSQLGFLFLLVGSGRPALVFGGIALVLAHGLFKSALFLVVGAIDKATGTRDLRDLSGLRRSMPITFWVAVAASASMAAVPATFGFVAKEAAFDGLVAGGVPLVAAIALASVLTVAYTGRFLVGAFGAHQVEGGPARADGDLQGVLTWAPASLATVGLVLGVAPGLVVPLVEAAAIDTVGEAVGKLVVWPGLVPALGWSLASLALGTLFVVWPRPIATVTEAFGRFTDRLPGVEGAFRGSVTGLISGADRLTGVVQNGSLPAYVAVILAVAIALPSTGFGRALLGSPVPPMGGSLEIVLGIVVAISAVAIAVIRRRFAAVILLGGVGYGIAGIFAVVGGPDLAVTQILIETLTIALFALVLRHLPAEFARPRAQLPRALVGVAAGVAVFVGGLVSVGARTGAPVSEYFLEESLPSAAGRNVVNVILVDFRALDTLGEITVLAVATLGGLALVLPFVRRDREGNR